MEEKEGFYQLQIWLPKDYSETLNKELDQMRLSDSNFTKPKIVEVSSRDMSRMINHKKGRRNPKRLNRKDLIKTMSCVAYSMYA